jgi:prolyl-tRNA editing enzyme YbaK/EbsC (Cys-tRNA(Pro) deacylase)
MSNEQAIKGSAAKVQQALREHGLSTTVREMPASTRTAKEAATAIGCGVGQIAKSLIFRGVQTGGPLLVIASGNNRVNEARLSVVVGEPIARATPDFVRDATGYAIGGVPPIGHEPTLRVWIDEDLFVYDVIWAAAGTPFTVFAIAPADLRRVTGAVVVDVK